MKLLKNSSVAIVTPFKENLDVDYKKFEDLVIFHLQNKTSGIVVSGTTGEGSTLELEEKLKLLEIAVSLSEKKVPVIFGSGTNNTKQSIFLSKKAEELKADGLLTITPYYNKPTQKGLYAHFKEIAKAVSLPVYLYNVPSRTSVNLEVSTVIELSKIDNIVGLKDATADLSRTLTLRKELKDFILLSGEDATNLSYLANGGSGTISVSANITPLICEEICEAFFNKDNKKALDLQMKILDLHKILFCETNPVPVKYALSLMGLIDPYVRLPLVELEEKSKIAIREVLKTLDLIK